MFNLDHLVRPVIAKMSAYSSARTEFTGDASIFLDANESPFNKPYNRYPDPLQKKLKEHISKMKRIGSEKIFLGNGSDEAIDLLFRCFCEPRIDNAVTISPSYGMYEVAANTNDVTLRKASLTVDFDLDLKAIQDQIDEHTRLIFLCSPNNPSGNSLDPVDMMAICNSFKGLVVIDEAYIDFAEQDSFLSKLDDLPNIVILQTFSKAWGMAGIRLGMAFASANIIELFNKVKYPYNINVLTQELGLKLLENQENLTHEVIQIIVEERKKMINQLQAFDWVEKVFPSDANFLLVKVIDANKIYQFLIDHSIIIRNRHNVTLCENCLRISIGNPQENKQVIDALKSL